MQRFSPSIGTLASVLAKAQGELIKPEKSLVATIRRDGPNGTEQAFRYAPLSSGLDIVRKVLGQHRIATAQTTSIDQDAGLISLTTVLAHASGKWIASDWPVCAVSDARRYALFTLVGIAGEGVGRSHGWADIPAKLGSFRQIVSRRRELDDVHLCFVTAIAAAMRPAWWKMSVIRPRRPACSHSTAIGRGAHQHLRRWAAERQASR